MRIVVLGHLLNFVCSTAVRLAFSCNGALISASVRALSCDCASLISAAVGLKKESGRSTRLVTSPTGGL